MCAGIVVAAAVEPDERDALPHDEGTGSPLFEFLLEGVQNTGLLESIFWNFTNPAKSRERTYRYEIIP